MVTAEVTERQAHRQRDKARLTPSEAKLACIIARGAPPDIAARELKISRETARNQLKSVFAKTDAHRQSELVALLLQVG